MNPHIKVGACIRLPNWTPEDHICITGVGGTRFFARPSYGESQEVAYNNDTSDIALTASFAMFACAFWPITVVGYIMYQFTRIILKVQP